MEKDGERGEQKRWVAGRKIFGTVDMEKADVLSYTYITGK
jgi:hypothetical protein